MGPDRRRWSPVQVLAGVVVGMLAAGLVLTEGLLANTTVGPDGKRTLQGLDISFGESPKFNGKAVVALASDPNVIEKAGHSFFTGAVAREYGFTEDDGTLPPLTESGLMSLMDPDDIPEYWRGVDRFDTPAI